jgi:hypothetical protein
MSEKKEKLKANHEFESEILYSKAIKAGKRVYYLDVKRNAVGELYVSITESKKIRPEGTDSVTYEKHKVFIFNEDFDKFIDGIQDVVEFAKNNQNKVVSSGISGDENA